MKSAGPRRALVYLAVLSLALPAAAPAQEPGGAAGTIAGIVLDAATGDPLIDAGVEVVGTGRSARTDLDGRFSLRLPPGTYEVRFFAPLYQGARLPTVAVQAGKVARADATLQPAGEAGVEVVEVIAEADRAAEATQLLRRKKAPVISDNIAAETIKKSPDSDAAEVVQRVPAVTVKDDKFIFVRGLNERYSSALVEGSRLPSPDPDRRVVPLDLFPADFLESISVVKSYTPDLPGDFSGGLADIRLREFPDKLTAGAGVSIGGNTRATFQDFDTYKGGGFDYFGFDQNVRSLPSLIPDGNIRGATPAQAQAFGRSFKNIWETDEVSAPPNFGFTFNLGDTIGPVGLSLAGVYSTEYKVRPDQIERQYLNAGTPEEPQIRLGNDFTFDTSTFETRLGAVFTSAWQLAPRHRLTFRSLLNRNTTDEVAIGRGIGEQSGLFQESASLKFTQEELAFWQLAGEHRWSWIDVDWRTAFSRTKQDVPDNRFTFRTGGVFTNEGNGGTRAFGELEEFLTDSQVDFTIPFATALPFTDVWSGLPAKLKLGPAYAFRDRDSTLRVFRFNRVGALDTSLPFERIFAPENIGPQGLQFVEDTLPQNAFAATEEIAGGYAMVDLPIVRDRLRFIGGARAEYSYIVLDTFDPVANAPRTVIKKNLDPLPGANLVYALRDDMNLRFGWSRSVSRPEFRELSPAVFPAARGLRSVVGNPALVQADIESWDLRWEWFFSSAELVSLGGFYKTLDQPIEQVVITQGGSQSESFANAEDADLKGFEVEGRKHFGFASPALEGLSLVANVAYVDSEVRAGERGLAQVQTSDKRQLQGQAPFVVNAALEYAHERWGTARLLYNTAGARISNVGAFGLPDIFEERRDQLDLVYLTRIAPFGTPLNFKLAVENILDDRYQLTQGDELAREYKTGVKFSFGVSYTY
jgi:hypothetical protein